MTGLILLCQVARADYNQNFNTLPNTGTSATWTNNGTLLGWYAASAGTGQTTVLNIGTGTGTTGGLWDWGVAGVNPVTDRALGSIGSNGTGTQHQGVVLVNTSGSVINSVTVSFTGEQWRDGNNANTQSLTFGYQVLGTVNAATFDIRAGTYTGVGALTFTSPIANTGGSSALDGNAGANRTALTSTISVTINPGEFFVIRWEDLNDSANDHGLAVDDLTVTGGFTPIPEPATVAAAALALLLVARRMWRVGAKRAA